SAACLTQNGGVSCWGSGSGGILPSQSLTPVLVPELATGMTRVTGGGSSACALRGSGTVDCWGSNDGTLGSGTAVGSSLRPTTVVGLAGATDVRSGGRVGSGVTCALTTAGGVKCWGLDWLLGNGVAFKPYPDTTRTNQAVDSNLTSGVQTLD